MAISSGRAHVRYQHGRGLTRLALACPACGAEARATLPCHAEGRLSAGDLSPEYASAEWRVACTACAHRAGPFDHATMRAHAPLYFIKDDFWAWNREHLAMVLAVLEQRDVAADPYAWQATYIPGAWLRRRAHYAKLAKRLLAL